MKPFGLMLIAAKNIWRGLTMAAIDGGLELLEMNGLPAPQDIHLGIPTANGVTTTLENQLPPDNLCIIFAEGHGTPEQDQAIVKYLLTLPEPIQQRVIIMWTCTEHDAPAKCLGFTAEQNIYFPTSDCPPKLVKDAILKAMRK